MLISSVQFNRSVVSDSLKPHGLQHTRLPFPSPTPGACSNSCPSRLDAIQPSHSLSSPSLPAFSLSQHKVFSKESVLCIRWPKYWSLSVRISPSNAHPGLISFRMDWLDLLAVQGTLSHVQFFATLWTVVCQAPLSMRFSRKEYWSGLPCPPPGDPPSPGIELTSL